MTSRSNGDQHLLKDINHYLSKEILFNRDIVRYFWICLLFDLYLMLHKVIHRSIYYFFQACSDVYPTISRLKEVILTDVVNILIISNAISGSSHLTKTVLNEILLSYALLLNILSHSWVPLTLKLLCNILKSVFSSFEIFQVWVGLGGVVINSVHHALCEINHLFLRLLELLQPYYVRFISNNEDSFIAASKLYCDLIHGEELAGSTITFLWLLFHSLVNTWLSITIRGDETTFISSIKMLILGLIDSLVICIVHHTRTSIWCVLTLFRATINILFGISMIVHNSFQFKCCSTFVFLNEIPDWWLLIFHSTYLTTNFLRPFLDLSRLKHCFEWQTIIELSSLAHSELMVVAFVI